MAQKVFVQKPVLLQREEKVFAGKRKLLQYLRIILQSFVTSLRYFKK